MAAATHTQKPGKGAPLGFEATWQLANMNLAICGIEGNLGRDPADSFHRNLNKDLKTEFVIATA